MAAGLVKEGKVVEVETPLEQWARAKHTLAQWQKFEKDSRELLLKSLGVKPEDVGTSRFDVDGRTVKVAIRESYKLDAGMLTDIRDDLLANNVPSDVVRWKAELDAARYKKLTDAQKAAIGPAVTVSYTSPQVELEGDDRP